MLTPIRKIDGRRIRQFLCRKCGFAFGRAARWPDVKCPTCREKVARMNRNGKYETYDERVEKRMYQLD